MGLGTIAPFGCRLYAIQNKNDTKYLFHMYKYCWCIGVVSRFFLQQMSQMGVKEVSQDVLDLCGLGAPCSRDQHRIQGRVQDLGGAESSRAGLCSVKTFDGTGEPDESLQTLDVSPTVMHQLVFGHSPAAAGRTNTSDASQLRASAKKKNVP